MGGVVYSWRRRQDHSDEAFATLLKAGVSLFTYRCLDSETLSLASCLYLPYYFTSAAGEV